MYSYCFNRPTNNIKKKGERTEKNQPRLGLGAKIVYKIPKNEITNKMHKLYATR